MTENIQFLITLVYIIKLETQYASSVPFTSPREHQERLINTVAFTHGCLNLRIIHHCFMAS